MSDELTITYEGAMHAEARKTDSEGTLIMNASPCCGGSGEGFGPIDVLAAAYGGCVVMAMDMTARKSGFDIAGARISVSLDVKKLDNIRVDAVRATVVLPREYTDEQLDILRKGEAACPVHNSLHPDAKKTLTFEVAEAVDACP